MPTIRTRRAGLPPAFTYEFLVGDMPPVRLDGRWDVLWAGQHGAPTLDEVFDEHRTALLRIARQHAFKPYWLTGVRPRGARFEQWRAQFLAEHGER
jgi:hypothetical protein